MKIGVGDLINFFINNLKLGFALIIFLVFFPFPDFKEGLIWEPISNSVHLILGIFIYLISKELFERRYGTLRSRDLSVLFFSLGGAFVIEFLQPFVGRGMSYEDIILSFWGSLIAHLFIQGSRPAIVLPVLIGILFAVFPIIKGIRLTQLKIDQFPVIVENGSEFNETFKKILGAEVSINDKECAVGVEAATKYAGVEIPLSSQNWSTYNELVLRLENKSGTDETWGLRIDDVQGSANYKDRFNDKINLRPGMNEYVVSLSKMKEKVISGNFKLEEIKRVILFRLEEQKATLCIHRIILR